MHAQGTEDREQVHEQSKDVLMAKCIAIIDDEPSVREGMVAPL